MKLWRAPVNYRAYTGRNTDFYETTSAVADVVNLAIALGRPILVEGEAGCGKTQLATLSRVN
jgi:MoxR-like ATPase